MTNSDTSQRGVWGSNAIIPLSCNDRAPIVHALWSLSVRAYVRPSVHKKFSSISTKLVVVVVVVVKFFNKTVRV